MIEILEDIEIDEELLESVRRLKSKGYCIALDDFIYRDGYAPLVDLADVVKLDVTARQVIVGPKSALATRTVPIREVNWLGDGDFDAEDARHILVRVRSTRQPAPAIMRPTGPNSAMVELLTPEEGVAPGQACVFYDPDSSRVLGGGWIWQGPAA